MKKGLSLWRGRKFLLAVEAGFQDRLDALVGAGVAMACPFGSSFQAIGAVSLSEPQDAETGAESLLRVWLGLKDALNDLSRERSDARRPSHQALRSPFQITLMGFRPVRIDSGMARF